jgi:hypothetical protein
MSPHSNWFPDGSSLERAKTWVFHNSNRSDVDALELQVTTLNLLQRHFFVKGKSGSGKKLRGVHFSRNQMIVENKLGSRRSLCSEIEHVLHGEARGTREIQPTAARQITKSPYPQVAMLNP